MNIINLTQHEVTLKHADRKVTYPLTDTIARVTIEKVLSESTIDGFPVYHMLMTSHTLPEPVNDTLYIVSMLVKNAFPGRTDLIVPDANNGTRNKLGIITSVPGFIK